MRAHAKPSGTRCALFAGAALAAAMLTMVAMPCSASAQHFSFDYSYGYPGTAYSYSPYWYPGYSYPYYPFYAHRHHWYGDWDHDRWDRHWAGHGWDHGGLHNSGRGQEAHGGGGRASPDSRSIARGNQFRNFLFHNFH